MQAAPGFNLVVVNRVSLFASQKVRFLFRGSRRRLLSQTAKEAGVQRARLAVGFFEQPI